MLATLSPSGQLASHGTSAPSCSRVEAAYIMHVWKLYALVSTILHTMLLKAGNAPAQCLLLCCMCVLQQTSGLQCICWAVQGLQGQAFLKIVALGFCLCPHCKQNQVVTTVC